VAARQESTAFRLRITIDLQTDDWEEAASSNAIWRG
jgi:hypothetical protein